MIASGHYITTTTTTTKHAIIARLLKRTNAYVRQLFSLDLSVFAGSCTRSPENSGKFFDERLVLAFLFDMLEASILSDTKHI